MIAVDTNILLRYLAQDGSEEERSRAVRLIETEARVFVGDVVLVETYWVLRRVYDFPKGKVLSALASMLASDTFEFQERDVVAQVVENPDIGLADALLARAAQRSNASVTYTFDRKAARRVEGMELLT